MGGQSIHQMTFKNLIRKIKHYLLYSNFLMTERSGLRLSPILNRSNRHVLVVMFTLCYLFFDHQEAPLTVYPIQRSIDAF